MQEATVKPITLCKGDTLMVRPPRRHTYSANFILMWQEENTNVNLPCRRERGQIQGVFKIDKYNVNTGKILGCLISKKRKTLEIQKLLLRWKN